MLLDFFRLIETDEDLMPLMKATMRKAQGGALCDMKGSSVWRKYKLVKAFIVYQMMPFW